MAHRNENATQPRRTTLLALVNELQSRYGYSEDEVVRLVPALLRSGRVVLSGNFAGCLLDPA